MKLIAGRARCRLPPRPPLSTSFSSSAALGGQVRAWTSSLSQTGPSTARATTSRSPLCGRLDAPPSGPSSAGAWAGSARAKTASGGGGNRTRW